jgi:hypothetical protein
MIKKVLKVISIIKGDFLSIADIMQGIEPKFLILVDHFRIRLTGVVNQAGVIVLLVPVEVPLIVQVEYINRGPTRFLRFLKQGQATAVGFLLVDAFTDILNYAGALLDRTASKNATAMYS